jgi:ribosomal protein S27AE
MQKDCPACGAKKVLMEALEAGYRLTCQSCGFSQVYDDGHKKLLTDERYSAPLPQRVLVD